MCWLWKKNIKHPPILEKYKRCNNCQILFNINHSNYLKLKKNKKTVYYCQNKCYIKYINIGKEFFDITI